MSSWDTIDVGGADSYFRLADGENKVHLLTAPEEFLTHFMPDKTAITCIGDKCPGCAEGIEPSKRFYFWLIDRKDGKVKLAEFGPGIVRDLKKLRDSEEYSFQLFPEYDITIVKTGSGMSTKYDVLPGRKVVALTPDELESFASKEQLSVLVEKKKAETTPLP